MIIDITVTLLTATATATAVNDIAVTVVLNDEVVNPEETFCERVDDCLDIPSTNGNYVLKILNGVKSWVAESAGGGVWGSITGTITNQTDLVNYITTRLTGYATEAFVTTQGYITDVITALGYTPENVANKTDVMSGNTTSSVKYLSAKGVYDWVISLGYITSAALTGYLTSVTAAATYQVILTAANFGAFINSLTGKVTPVDADSISIVDSADSNNAKKLSWANLKATLKTYFDTLYQSVSNIYYYKLYKWSGSVAITGTTSETQFTGVSAFIPANTLNVGDRLVCESLVLHPSGSSGIGRFRIGTSSAPSPVTNSSEIGYFGNIGTATYLAMSKTFIYVKSSTQIYYLNSTSFANDVVSSNASSYSTASFNSTVDNYVIPTIKPNNSPDTYTLVSFTVAKI